MYNVKLEKFEGPFDLLYQLIEAKKLEITEISLAQVASQFLDYLKGSEKTGISDVADFLVVAGRLALIKSRALLPFLELSPEEEGDIEGLKEQLAEYYKYRELAKGIHKLDISKNIFYARQFLAGIEPVFYFPKKLTSEKLSDALGNLLATITLPQRIPQAQAKSSMPFEKALEKISATIKNRIEIRFSEILKSLSPEEKVVAFLSVLELIKRSDIEAEQKRNFEEIILTNSKSEYPLRHSSRFDKSKTRRVIEASRNPKQISNPKFQIPNGF